MIQPLPTPAAEAFLHDLGASRAHWSLGCPAVSVEGAKQWAVEGMALLWGAMTDGRIESIDGEPCLQTPAMATRKRGDAVHDQMKLGAQK